MEWPIAIQKSNCWAANNSSLLKYKLYKLKISMKCICSSYFCFNVEIEFRVFKTASRLIKFDFKFDLNQGKFRKISNQLLQFF